MVIRSRLSYVVFAKIWGTILCGSASLLILLGGFSNRGWLLALPFLVGAFFAGSIAIVQVRNGAVYYKRLFRWTIIPESQIMDARVEWPRAIGSLRLKRFLFPWGRLYFVLDSATDPNPFREGTYPLLRLLNKKSIPQKDVPRTATQEGPPKTAQRLKLLSSAVAGALFYTWTRVLSPQSGSRQPAHVVYLHEPSVIRVQNKLVQLLHSNGVVLVLFVVFGFMTIYRNRKPESWIFAFLTGVSLTYVIVRWM